MLNSQGAASLHSFGEIMETKLSCFPEGAGLTQVQAVDCALKQAGTGFLQAPFYAKAQDDPT